MNLDFDMGRYAAFIWPAWAISMLVLGALIAETLMRARHARQALRDLGGDPDE